MPHSTDSAALSAAIAKAHYLADDDGVRALGRVCVGATAMIGECRSTYLRVVLAHTQAALGLTEPRTASAKSLTIADKATRATQRAALDATATRLYALVTGEVITADIKDRGRMSADERKRRAAERQSRTAFARSAASTLRQALAVSVSLLDLGVTDVTKYALGKLIASRTAPRPQNAQRRMAALRRRLSAALDALAKIDKTQARALAQSIVDHIGAWQMTNGKPTRNAARSMADGQAWSTKTGIFLPVHLPAPEARQ